MILIVLLERGKNSGAQDVYRRFTWKITILNMKDLENLNKKKEECCQSFNDIGNRDFSSFQERSMPLEVWSFHFFEIVDITKQNSISNINDSMSIILIFTNN